MRRGGLGLGGREEELEKDTVGWGLGAGEEYGRKTYACDTDRRDTEWCGSFAIGHRVAKYIFRLQKQILNTNFVHQF